MYCISVTDYARDALLRRRKRSTHLSASFNMFVKTSLLRFNAKTVNYIRKGLEREYEPERRLKMDSMWFAV